MADEPIWEEKYKQLEDQYRKDMGLAYQALQQQQPQQQVPEEPLWDTSDPQKLKGQIEDSLRKTVVDTLSPVVNHFSGNQFESNMAIVRADSRFPHFSQWENEIRQLAQQVPPALLGKPETVAGLYGLVASRHSNELVEMEVQRRMQVQEQEKPEDTGEVEIDGEEEDEEEKEKPSQPVPAPQPQPQPRPQQQVARPQSAVSTAASTQPSRSTRPPQQKLRLTREEAYMAEQMGMSHKEYALAKNLGDAEI